MTTTAESSARTTTVAERGRLRIAVLTLSLLTAAVHLYLGVITAMLAAGDQAEEYGGPAGLFFFSGLFFLSGVGYVVLPAVLYRTTSPRLARLARWGLVAWTAGNVLAYVALVQGAVDALGIVDKAVELALIALLVIGARNTRD